MFVNAYVIHSTVQFTRIQYTTIWKAYMELGMVKLQYCTLRHRVCSSTSYASKNSVNIFKLKKITVPGILKCAIWRPTFDLCVIMIESLASFVPQVTHKLLQSEASAIIVVETVIITKPTAATTGWSQW